VSRGIALPRFLDGFPSLTVADRVTLVDAAVRVLDGCYAHLRQKRARYGTDPIGRLRALRDRAEDLSDRRFLEEVAAVFTDLRDLHTGVAPPEPLRSAVAVLGILVERYERRGEPVYVVTKIASGLRVGELREGMRVTHWNGVPIDHAVERHAERTRGANEPARRARGLESLTVRPLAEHLPPDEHWVDLTFVTPDRRSLTTRLAWRVLTERSQLTELRADRADGAGGRGRGRGRRALAAQLAAAPVHLAVDPGGEAAQQAKRQLFGRRGTTATPSSLPIFRATVRGEGRRRVGHLRIWSFLEVDHDAVVDECARLLRAFEAQGCRGVLVDIRGNPGGVVLSAERLLQLFTPDSVEPVRFAFTPTPLTRAFCSIDPSLGAWLASIEAAEGSGEVYSQAYPITDPDRLANGYGWHTTLPAVMVVDPLCYSSADLFAAGWVDNEIGPIVGTGPTTGAGGANVWTDADIRLRVEGDDPVCPPVLSGGVDLRVAVRRALRVRAAAGIPIEDIGVAVPERDVFPTSRRDLLQGNADLLDRAAARLFERSSPTAGPVPSQA
jgi:hypothetical protein